MRNPEYLFEISWEVCNMVGGIYTVLSTKAGEVKTLLGDHYVTVGPDMVKESHETRYFVEDVELLREWREAATAKGLKVRVGRWKIDPRPIAILVDYTPLFPKKDEILGKLWERFQLDSIQGQWDYIEPVMFGYAAGQVIEHYVNWNLPRTKNIVANFHEWMTGAGVLYLKDSCPQVATIFTTHATYLGRAISGNGLPLYDNMGQYDPAIMASRFNIVAQQSMERQSTKNADVFTTVSDITAQECKQFLGRQPDVITENGISDKLIIDTDALREMRKASRAKVRKVAETLCGTPIDEDAVMIINSGRYEFKNKGIDMFIEALGRLNKSNSLQKTIIGVIAVPANIAGPSMDLQRRLEGKDLANGKTDFPATHHIFEYEHDAILNALFANGLCNNINDKVKVMFVPAYLNGNDGIFDIDYQAFLSAFDLSVFPSYYEPWGYTPMESIAMGIPTITTDRAGFGKYVLNAKEEGDAVVVLHRKQDNSEEVIAKIAEFVLRLVEKADEQRMAMADEARGIAEQLKWSRLIKNYWTAYDKAIEKTEGRYYLLETHPYADMLHEVYYPKQDRPTWKKFLVKPVFSDEMTKLQELSRNIWWSWNYEASDLFKSIDSEAWYRLEQNPVALLENLSKPDLERLENDSEFISNLNNVYDAFKAYMTESPSREECIAYFSMEYGLTKSLKIYSGGLGILAGDYMKQASDSNVNMIGIGLLYRYGYFQQEISVNGEQLSQYVPQKFSQLPLDPIRDKEGNWVTISVAFPGRMVYAKAWRVNVGRVSLYLLDTDIEDNSPEDRAITGKLYGGDSEMRFKQEMFLGVGGIRLLEALDIKPLIYHCNEGHAAFSGLERLKVYVNRYNLDFEVAKELVRASTLFTTHTPVPAGHDAFEEHLLRTYMPHYAGRMNISWDDFMNLGRFRKNDPSDKFSMSVLATNLSQEVNGVSKIHGRVSREMFQCLWPGYYAEEIHIGSVTNGVHLPTWANTEWQKLYKKTLGLDYVRHQSDSKVWNAINDVSDGEIWTIRKTLKHNLIDFISKRIQNEMRARQDSPKLINKTIENLNEDALIIGFARRFATYKRAHLLFTNLERLSKIVNNEKRPVLFLFAGKAHPNDKAGQDLIKMIIDISRRPEFIGKVLFVSNYDMELGKCLTNGVDIWLNTPTRPLEASGTSGEKAVMNGVLNFSVLDGWWAEGYRPNAGWAMPEKRTYQNQQYQDEMDAEMIYNLLESEITTLYFDRDDDGVPHGWVKSMKNNFTQIAPHFTMKRMLEDYYDRYYNKLIERTLVMTADNYRKAFEINAWKNKVRANWDRVEVMSLKVPDTNVRALTFGDVFVAEITLSTAGLDRGDVGVELLFGNKNNDKVDEIVFVEKMTLVDAGEDWARYYINVPIYRAGVYNYTFRIFPDNDLLPHRQDFPMVKWV